LEKNVWTREMLNINSGDDKSVISGEAIKVIREIFTPKVTGYKVNLQQKLFSSPAEEYFTPKKQDKNKREKALQPE
jgi:hypothetical protein